MADLIIEGSAHMHFSSTGVGSVQFGRTVTQLPRSISNLIVTVSGGTTISFDGGVNFLPLTDGTHQFLYLHSAKLHFGNGTWAGVGISI